MRHQFLYFGFIIEKDPLCMALGSIRDTINAKDTTFLIDFFDFINEIPLEIIAAFLQR